MQITFIGLGDVGSRFSAGVSDAGKAVVVGYDSRLGEKGFEDKEERCRTHGVKLAEKDSDAVIGSDIIIAATSCSRAISTAEQYLPYMKPGQMYVDINSAVPEIKEEIAKMMNAKGIDFCDGGIMGSPLNGGVHVEVVMSGPKAKWLTEQLNECGMNTRFISETVGRGSSLKILRSIFTKGLEALLIETYSSAYRYGVLDEVKGSIVHILTKENPETNFARMLRTNVVHSRRRAEEVGDVAKMLENAGMNHTMSSASYEKLMWAYNTGIKEVFDGKIPEDVMEVVKFYAALKED